MGPVPSRAGPVRTAIADLLEAGAGPVGPAGPREKCWTDVSHGRGLGWRGERVQLAHAWKAFRT